MDSIIFLSTATPVTIGSSFRTSHPVYVVDLFFCRGSHPTGMATAKGLTTIAAVHWFGDETKETELRYVLSQRLTYIIR